MAFEIGHPEVKSNGRGKLVLIPLTDYTRSSDSCYTVIFENDRGRLRFLRIEPSGLIYEKLEEQLRKRLEQRAKASLAVKKDSIRVLEVDRVNNRTRLAYVDFRGPEEVTRYAVSFQIVAGRERKLRAYDRQSYDETGGLEERDVHIPSEVFNPLAHRAYAILF